MEKALGLWGDIGRGVSPEGAEVSVVLGYVFSFSGNLPPKKKRGRRAKINIRDVALGFHLNQQGKPQESRRAFGAGLGSAEDAIGFGFFQVRLLIIAGLGFMADSIEVGHSPNPPPTVFCLVFFPSKSTEIAASKSKVRRVVLAVWTPQCVVWFCWSCLQITRSCSIAADKGPTRQSARRGIKNLRRGDLLGAEGSAGVARSPRRGKSIR